MAVVIDANVVVALASRDHRSEAVDHHFDGWIESGEDIHAPDLITYEVASALVQISASGQLDRAERAEAWERYQAMPITLHHVADGNAVMDITIRLQRRSAYDSAYLYLAQQMKAELWTFDGRLYRNAIRYDFPVRLIEVV